MDLRNVFGSGPNVDFSQKNPYRQFNRLSRTNSEDPHFNRFIGKHIRTCFSFRLAVGREPRFSSCSTFVENRGYRPSAISLFHSKTHTDDGKVHGTAIYFLII